MGSGILNENLIRKAPKPTRVSRILRGVESRNPSLLGWRSIDQGEHYACPIVSVPFPAGSFAAGCSSDEPATPGEVSGILKAMQMPLFLSLLMERELPRKG